MRTALGFRAHSGWAAMVTVAGTIDAPRVLNRRRIVIADPEMPGSKQPYHAAAELPFSKAESLVRRAIESSRGLAFEAISSAVSALRAQGHEVGACGILLGSGKPLPSLERILASHAMIHTAEGEMFRDVLVRASTDCGISVSKIKERELLAQASASSSLPEAKLQQHLAAFGKQLGPPWRQDEKFATLAAWIALIRASSSAQRAIARAI